MKNYLVFHGHFYQPPREDPWTGIVAIQPSAAPFHDWNHRITRECYAANAASRVLRFDGRIEDIINNYKILSFNFGPTLFWWLKSHAPHVYEAIIEADRLSVTLNSGHGNAIAQAYNHTILPLDSADDSRLQIEWGLADFEYHFGRKSEGIWLPETAINEGVADILLDLGVKYVILSPWQAEAIYAEGSEEWQELESEPAPFWRPYKIERPGGDLAAFFYNQELAQGISFEHYLRSADALYNRLLT
ncbi:MAG TPA: glycoside hydrolase, partial [Clostridia bacterium]|nr:glycoside hydrolase [Clostridia bacterium]